MSDFFGRTDLNVGQDVSVVLSRSDGKRWTSEQLGILTDIECDFEDHEVTVKGMNFKGLPSHISIPAGVMGKISFARIDATLAKVLAERQSAFYDSGQLYYYTLQFQVRNRDGSIDSCSVMNVAISKGKVLGAKADKEVDQGFSFRGSELVITS